MTLGDRGVCGAVDGDSRLGGLPRPKCAQNDGGEGGGDGLPLLLLLSSPWPSDSMGDGARPARAPVLRETFPPRGRTILRMLLQKSLDKSWH
jgi:hypothetical protein